MTPEQQAAQADKQIAMIKASMPAVYEAVQAKAAEIGREAFALVRRGARGEPNCFYAFEGGRVVGTPFDGDVPPDVAQLIVRFGTTFLCMWPATAKEGVDGAH